MIWQSNWEFQHLAMYQEQIVTLRRNMQQHQREDWRRLSIHLKACIFLFYFQFENFKLNKKSQLNFRYFNLIFIYNQIEQVDLTMQSDFVDTANDYDAFEHALEDNADNSQQTCKYITIKNCFTILTITSYFI